MAGTLVVNPKCQLNHPREDIITGPVSSSNCVRAAALAVRPPARINRRSPHSHSTTLDHITGSRTALLQSVLGAEYQSFSAIGRGPMSRSQFVYTTYQR